MTSPLYIAVDLGAGSGRVFLVGLEPSKLLFEEIRRFQYPPREKDGHLRWDFACIFENVILGLSSAGERAKELARPIVSLGIDSWAVDYGLLDADGNLIADPICYRDGRTQGAMERVFSELPRLEIFERTGIQFLNFNTLFQLYSEDSSIDGASRVLLLPDLVNFFLTGNAVAEYTNATTTQMVNAGTRDWDLELIHRLCLRANMLPDIVAAGTDIGEIKPGVLGESRLDGLRVIAPATHDTASAVVAAPLEQGWAYISSGTWSLVGVELNEPLINAGVAAENFTNEGGAYGTVRFLKNVMGLWIFESCRREWRAELSYEETLAGIGEVDDFPAFIFPDDRRFLNPPSMTAAIHEQLEETGQNIPNDQIEIAKLIFDSLAFRYASVLQSIEKLTKQKLVGIQVLGGGGRNTYLNQTTADASGSIVRAGLSEATVVGNVLVQAISSGRFSSLAEARGYVADNFDFEEFVPQQSSEIEEARSRYAAIEALFLT